MLRVKYILQADKSIRASKKGIIFFMYAKQVKFWRGKGKAAEGFILINKVKGGSRWAKRYLSLLNVLNKNIRWPVHPS